jgi:hypothetical protein
MDGEGGTSLADRRASGTRLTPEISPSALPIRVGEATPLMVS